MDVLEFIIYSWSSEAITYLKIPCDLWFFSPIKYIFRLKSLFQVSYYVFQYFFFIYVVLISKINNCVYEIISFHFTILSITVLHSHFLSLNVHLKHALHAAGLFLEMPFAMTWRDLDGIMLSEIRKKNTVWFHLEVEYKNRINE